MRFSDFINRLLHLRLKIREGYWLQFKLGSGDTFTVSIGHENYHGYKNSNVIFRNVLRNIDPEAAWNEIYGKCLINDYINNDPDLFKKTTMKTPKREDVDPIGEPVYDEMFGICDITSDFGPRHTAHARWKRRNKIKQLKRSLQRYKHGTMLPKLMAIRCAYKRLQELKKPSRKASSISWFDYIAELRTIEQDIIRAIVDAASYYGAALEREEQQ